MNPRILKVVIYFFMVYFFCLRSIIAQDFMPLWGDGKMPNSKGIKMEDSIANERIFKVAVPGIWSYFPSAQENKHAAVIICPGGGYQREAYIISGTQLAKWFNSIGINAFVLKYRLPNSPDLLKREIGPLQDAQRAMRLIRANAVRWGIDRTKIGIMGTSSGGHLASTLGTHLEDVSSISDSLDRISFLPNFLILISPVIDLGKYAHVGSRDNLLGDNVPREFIEKYSSQLQVTSKTPPSFIVHAVNDQAVPVQNSLLFYNALIDNNVISSIHIFPQGAHSIALRNNPGSTETWPTLCEMWMKEMGFILSN
jgi:acetyl esterase/lipase